MKLFFILVFLVASAVAQETCSGQNEEYRNDRCEGSCDSMDGELCEEEATSRCRCMKGFYRNSDDICVTLDECACKVNEKYREGCEKTCERPDEDCSGIERGCLCQSGYLRHRDGRCVLREECGETPIDDEVVAISARATTAKPNPTPTPTTEPTPTEEDPFKCKDNEKINYCPGYCTFDPTCDSEFKGIVKTCPPRPDYFTCAPRCECSPGFVRIDGRCVSSDHCCCKNEVAVPYKGSCKEDKDCETPKCPKLECECKKHYSKDDKGVCVKKENHHNHHHHDHDHHHHGHDHHRHGHGRHHHGHGHGHHHGRGHHDRSHNRHRRGHGHKHHSHDHGHRDHKYDHYDDGEVHFKFKKDDSYYQHAIHLLSKLMSQIKKYCHGS